LEDCGSKFGSLVLAKDAIEIDENTKILQIGRTLMSVNNSKYEKKNSSKSENLNKLFSEGKSEGKNRSSNNIPTFDFEAKNADVKK